MEKYFEDKLNIRTSGIREWRELNKKGKYNRCESTPYEHLEKLFENYKFEEGDKLVDFGTGRGRVLFYIHHKFGIPVKGIELNELTLDEALANKMRYRNFYEEIEAPIRIEFGYAEKYEVKPDENKFFFFNPFKISIFKKVVKNIIKSYEENKRDIEIILYYPVYEYQKFLNKKTDFELTNKVVIEDTYDGKEMFLIYKLEG